MAESQGAGRPLVQTSERFKVASQLLPQLNKGASQSLEGVP